MLETALDRIDPDKIAADLRRAAKLLEDREYVKAAAALEVPYYDAQDLADAAKADEDER